MTILDALLKREKGDDLPHQTTDAELIAWAAELKQTGTRRRPLVADPID